MKYLRNSDIGMGHLKDMTFDFFFLKSEKFCEVALKSQICLSTFHSQHIDKTITCKFKPIRFLIGWVVFINQYVIGDIKKGMSTICPFSEK